MVSPCLSNLMRRAALKSLRKLRFMKLFYRERKEAADRCRETVGERDRQKDRENKLFQSEITNCKQFFFFFLKRKEQNQTRRNQKTNIKLARLNRLIISNGEKRGKDRRGRQQLIQKNIYNNNNKINDCKSLNIFIREGSAQTLTSCFSQPNALICRFTWNHANHINSLQ